MTEEQQAKFEGWAIVEVMGHQRYVGFVTTEAYGQAVLFRIDVPELGERERELKRPEWIHNQNLPAGARIKESAVPGYTKLIGSGSIYAITPCTQEAAMAAVEEMQPRKLMLLSLPDTKALAAAAGSGDYSCCGGNLERGHKQSCDVERDEEGDDDESDDEDEDFL